MIQFDVVSIHVDRAICASGECICTLNSVQTANLEITWPRQDIVGWDGLGNQEQISKPRAQLDFSYIYDGENVNEHFVGFSPSALDQSVPALSGINKERNYYLSANLASVDEIGYAGFNRRVFALGDGLVTNYAFDARVGRPSLANVTIEGLNLLVQASGSGQFIPSVDKHAGTGHTDTYTLPVATQSIDNFFGATPSSIVLTLETGSAFGALLSGNDSCPLQSFGFTVALPRTEVSELGWAYPKERPIQWPVTVNIRAEAILNGIQLNALNDSDCPDLGKTFSVSFNRDCNSEHYFSYRFENAKLERESLNFAVGAGGATTSLNWTLRLFDLNRTGEGTPGFYIDTELDSEAVVWRDRVICVGGTFESNSIQLANDLILAIKASTFDSKIKYLLPLLGRNVAAARVPLRDFVNAGIAENHNFTDSDFSQDTGLQGNGLTTYFVTNVKASQLGDGDNGGLGWWELNSPSALAANHVEPIGAYKQDNVPDNRFSIDLRDSEIRFNWGLSPLTDLQGVGNKHYYGQRDSTPERFLYIDGVEALSTTVVTSTLGIGDNDIIVGGVDTGNIFGIESWGGRCGVAYMTDGTLTAQEVEDLHTLLDTYLITPTGR